MLCASIETQADRVIRKKTRIDNISFVRLRMSRYAVPHMHNVHDIILWRAFAIVHAEVMIAINSIFLYVSTLRYTAAPFSIITAGIMAHDVV